MNRATLLSELREVLNDLSVGGGWTDSTLLGYLAEGQDEFCERTGWFIDKTNFTVTLQTGVSTYDIPDRVIQILEVWDGTRKLDKLDTGEVFSGTLVAGDPEQWQTDQETGTLEFDREPTSDENGDSFTLRVWRYSRYALDDVGATGQPAEPEIPSRFHRAMIEWGAYKALNHHDAETQDPVKAKDHLDNFEYYVTRGKAAFRKYHNMETRVGSDPAYRT